MDVFCSLCTQGMLGNTVGVKKAQDPHLCCTLTLNTYVSVTLRSKTEYNSYLQMLNLVGATSIYLSS